MTRVALVVPAFPSISETFIVSKALGLLERGWDIHMVTFRTDEDAWASFGPTHPVDRLRERTIVLPNPGPSMQERMAAIGVALVDGAKTPAATARHVRTTACTVGLRGLARGFLEVPLTALAPDVVHVEFGALTPGLLHLKDVLRCRLSASFRGYDIAYAGLDRRDYYTTTWESIDAAHFLGLDLWQRARRRGAPEDLNRAFIPPAIDVTRFAPRPPEGHWTEPIGTEQRPLRVLSVGRLHWKKGYEYALEAIAEVRRRGIPVTYRVVGDGPRLEAVSFWRHQLGLDDCVTLLGSMPPASVARELGDADIFLHAAVSEGFGNAPLEAQAIGLPVVCTDAEGLSENVANGETGLVVPRRDPSRLADALEHLTRDDTLRHALAVAGPQRIHEHFALPQHVDAWEQFFRSMIDSPT